MSQRICSVPDCGRKHKGRTLCEPHLDRLNRHGDPLPDIPIRQRGVYVVCSIDGCENPHKGRGLCVKHIQKDRKYGDPLAGREYFWAKGEFEKWMCDQPDTSQCIEAPGFKTRPQLHFRGVMRNASRVAWILLRGDPGSLQVLHTCDNDACVNIRHLYLGDCLRNMHDTLVRERRSNHLFSNADIVRIRSLRASGVRARAIADEYGVHIKRIWDIFAGRTYTFVS